MEEVKEILEKIINIDIDDIDVDGVTNKYAFACGRMIALAELALMKLNLKEDK